MHGCSSSVRRLSEDTPIGGSIGVWLAVICSLAGQHEDELSNCLRLR